MKSNLIKKDLKKSIKHFFKKMSSNENMCEEFIELMKKWGCLHV